MYSWAPSRYFKASERDTRTDSWEGKIKRQSWSGSGRDMSVLARKTKHARIVKITRCLRLGVSYNYAATAYRYRFRGHSIILSVVGAQMLQELKTESGNMQVSV